MYKKISLILSLLVLITALSSCASYQQNYIDSPGMSYNYDEIKDPHYDVIENIIYTPEDWPKALASDLYLPRKLPSKVKAWPVVLMVHGGGWSNRDRTDMNFISGKLAEHGYAVLNVEYRLVPQFLYPAPVQDLQMALRWIQNNAAKYQFDLNKLNAWGFSSGAHLVTLVAGVTPGEAQTLNLSPPLPKIHSVVAEGTPADLSVYNNSPIIVPFLGAKRDENPQLYRESSPITHVSPEDPPVFLYHGKRDQLVEKEQSINYYNALRKAGVPAELYLHPLWGHISMFIFGRDAENKAIAFYNHYNGRALTEPSK
ncbi:MAG TPA: alpha/beta hydrolase [Methylophaga sp.]|nr:alpha/beta hydrolase [Methylophaga sp.]HEC58706.1 alpha/beta hydrolase [Methylophaga sp.]